MYEPIQIHILRSLARRCSDVVFLDIGANIGAYSVVISAEQNVTECHAFEPVPTLFAELRENILRNGLDEKIHAHEIVLSDDDGYVEFLLRSKYGGDSGVLHTHLYSHLPFRSVERLRRRALDAVLAISGRCIIAKIDVEGHEMQVLKGSEGTLRRNKGYLQVEVLNEQREHEVVRFLEECGWFRLFGADRDHYFTNVDVHTSDANRMLMYEEAVQQFIDSVRSGEGAPYRRRVLPGVTLELSRSHANAVRRLFGRRREDS